MSPLLGQPTDPPPRAQPSAVEWMRQRTGIDLTPCPQCGHGPLVRSPLHPLTVQAPSPRGVREGADLGLVMTQHWTWPLPRGRRSARASLAPRDQCVSAASGGASAPVTHLLWCSPGAYRGGSDPAMTSWAPVHRPCWTLTSPTSRDTIPIRTRRSVVSGSVQLRFIPHGGPRGIKRSSFGCCTVSSTAMYDRITP